MLGVFHDYSFIESKMGYHRTICDSTCFPYESEFSNDVERSREREAAGRARLDVPPIMDISSRR